MCMPSMCTYLYKYVMRSSLGRVNPNSPVLTQSFCSPA